MKFAELVEQVLEAGGGGEKRAIAIAVASGFMKHGKGKRLSKNPDKKDEFLKALNAAKKKGDQPNESFDEGCGDGGSYGDCGSSHQVRFDPPAPAKRGYSEKGGKYRNARSGDLRVGGMAYLKGQTGTRPWKVVRMTKKSVTLGSADTSGRDFGHKVTGKTFTFKDDGKGYKRGGSYVLVKESIDEEFTGDIQGDFAKFREVQEGGYSGADKKALFDKVVRETADFILAERPDAYTLRRWDKKLTFKQAESLSRLAPFEAKGRKYIELQVEKILGQTR